MKAPSGHMRTEHGRAAVLCGGAVQNASLVARLLRADMVFPLVDHHAQGWLRVAPPELATEAYDLSLLLRREPHRRLNRFLEIHRVRGRSLIDAWCMGEQLPSLEHSRVECPGRDDDEPLVGYRLSDDDLIVLRSQREALTDLAERLGFADPFPRNGADIPEFNDAVEHALAEPGRTVGYRVPLGAVDHDACTLPLAGAQVDEAGALRAYPSVFVAGPALFPRAGAENPTLTTLALSEIVAARVAERWS
jgi:hypothetical protein